MPYRRPTARRTASIRGSPRNGFVRCHVQGVSGIVRTPPDRRMTGLAKLEKCSRQLFQSSIASSSITAHAASPERGDAKASVATRWMATSNPPLSNANAIECLSPASGAATSTTALPMSAGSACLAEERQSVPCSAPACIALDQRNDPIRTQGPDPPEPERHCPSNRSRLRTIRWRWSCEPVQAGSSPASWP